MPISRSESWYVPPEIKLRELEDKLRYQALRDRFAVGVLPALLSHHRLDEEGNDDASIAIRAYELADAMLAARANRQE